MILALMFFTVDLYSETGCIVLWDQSSNYIFPWEPQPQHDFSSRYRQSPSAWYYQDVLLLLLKILGEAEQMDMKRGKGSNKKYRGSGRQMEQQAVRAQYLEWRRKRWPSGGVSVWVKGSRHGHPCTHFLVLFIEEKHDGKFGNKNNIDNYVYIH